MNNAPVMVGAAVGSALMAASGVFSTGRLAAAGVVVIFAAAALKFFSGRKKAAPPTSISHDQREMVGQSRAVVRTR
jgi:hypothetical protein